MTNDFTRFNSWKVLAYADRMEKIVRGEMPYPVVCHVYLTNKCPLNCGYCIMKNEKKQHPNATLSWKVLEKLACELQGHTTLFHLSGGGEPLAHPDVNRFVKLLLEKGFKVAVSTNGLFLDRLREPVHHLRVSLDAASPSTFQKLKGATKEQFFRTLSNVRARTFWEPALDYEDIGLGFLVTLENWLEVGNFITLAEDLRVDFVHIRPVFYPDKARQRQLLSALPSSLGIAEEAAQFVAKVKIFSIREKFQGYWTPKGYTKCRATPLQAVVTATGELVVCQDVFIRWGDLNNQSFREAWFSSEHRQAIEKIVLDECPRCVETTHNRIIQEFYVDNSVRRELI